jgi:AcrR family transcriptional regulator
MSSEITMTAIADAFIRLAETTPIEKISVSDIVTESGKNRKTFYYHFDCKATLIHWIFRHDLARVLTREFDENELVYEPKAPDTFPNLPYYARKKVGVRSIDAAGFANAYAECCEARHDFYAKAFRMTGHDSLGCYLISLYTPAIEEDVRTILGGRYLNEKNIRFLAEFFVDGAVAYTITTLNSPDKSDLLTDVGPFQNIVHSSIEHAIREQQAERVL